MSVDEGSTLPQVNLPGQPGPPETPKEARARAKAEKAYHKAKRPWPLRHWFVTGTGALVVLIIIVAASSSNTKSPIANQANNPATGATAGTSATSEPTQQATKAPAPIPAPVVYNGAGDDVLKIQKPEGADQPAIAVITATGGNENFIVETLASDGSTTGGLVNTIGPYSGTVPLDFSGDSQTSSLKIQANGFHWTVKLESPRAAPVFTGSYAGHGDAVLLYKGSAQSAHITNSGGENFIVQLWSGDGSLAGDAAVNEIGAYDGTVQWLGGTGFAAIQSTANWTISTS